MALDSSSTYADVIAQYKDNVGYAREGSVAKCKLFCEAADLLLLMRPTEMRTGSESVRDEPGAVEKKLEAAEKWLSRNDATFGNSLNIGRTVSTSCENFRG